MENKFLAKKEIYTKLYYTSWSEEEMINMMMIILGYGNTADQPGWEIREKIRAFIKENEK